MLGLDILDFIKSGNDTLSVKLINAEVVKEIESDDATRYLSLTYEVDTVFAMYHITFPRLVLPIFTNKLPDVERGYCGVSYDVGYGYMACKIEPLVKCIQKKPKKMTIKEIEKALGTEIELVDENGNGLGYNIAYEKPPEILFGDILKECRCHIRDEKHDDRPDAIRESVENIKEGQAKASERKVHE